MKLTWENANNWIEKINRDKSDYEPKWKWDCNFKLDFDGGLISVTSRFYPPNKNKSKKWEGTLSIIILDTTITKKSFINEDLDKLKEEVEIFIKHYIEIIKSRLINF